MTKEELLKYLVGTSTDSDKTSVFNNQHVMTNDELVSQVWGYAAEIAKNYINRDVPIQIGTKALPRNGVRLVVVIADSYEHIGYACTLHAVSRRVKLLERVCDMFEEGSKPLAEEDYAIAIGERK